MDDILEFIESKNFFLRNLILIVCMLGSAITYNLFIYQFNLVIGGTGGVGLILNNLFNIDASITILILSIFFIILSFIFLGPKYSLGSIVSSLSYPIFVYLTENLRSVQVISNNDMLLVCIVSGVLLGFFNGVAYRIGFNSGGFAILSHILSKYLKFPYSRVNSIINAIIVICGAFTFGLTNMLFSLLFIFIEDTIMNKVIIGVSSNKTLFIITSKEEEIKEFILDEFKHGVTVFPVKGGEMEHRKHMLMATVPNRDYFKITEGIHKIDPGSFALISDSYEVVGGE